MKAVWLISPVAAYYVSGQNPELRLLQCPMASVRLRVTVAARAWKQAGHENVFIDPNKCRGFNWRKTDVCLVPKFYYDNPLGPWLAAIRAAKNAGCALVIDVCDYPEHKPAPVPEFYATALQMADVITVNSERMKELIGTGLVIEDAILNPAKEPAFAPEDRLKICWFGHPTNLPFLGTSIGLLAQFARQHPCRLAVVTTPLPDFELWAQVAHAQFAPDLEVELIPWSQTAQRQALQDCTLVLLPNDPEGAFKGGASANRLAEAVNAGRFAAANPLQSYQQFADAAWLGQNLVVGIEWALNNPNEVLERIRRGQKLVAERFTAEVLGPQWLKVLTNCCDG